MTMKINCDHKCHRGSGLNPWVKFCPICGCENANFVDPQTSTKATSDFIHHLEGSLGDFTRSTQNKPTGEHVVGYSCNGCNIKRWVTVPKKLRAVDIKVWVDGVADRVANDHAVASQGQCNGLSCNLFIPMNEEGEYGKFPTTEGHDEVPE